MKALLELIGLESTSCETYFRKHVLLVKEFELPCQSKQLALNTYGTDNISLVRFSYLGVYNPILRFAKGSGTAKCRVAS